MPANIVYKQLKMQKRGNFKTFINNHNGYK